MFEQVQKIIADQLGIDENKITPESNLIDDLKADSLDIVELVMNLEEEYNIEVPDDELPKLQTVQGILDFISAQEG